VLLDMQHESVSTLMALRKVGDEQSAVLKALHAVDERQLAQLERFNTDLAVSIGGAMDERIVPALERLLQSTNSLQKVQSGLGEELLKEVGNKISGAVSGAAGEEMRSMSEAIKESVRSLNEAALAMRDGQGKLVEVTSAIIEQMNQSFGSNSKRLRDETDDAVRRVVEQIGTAAGGFSAKIGGASQDAATALLSTSANLQNVVKECQRIVSTTEVTVQRFDSLVASVSAATQDIVSAHAALRTTAEPLQAVAESSAALIRTVDRQVATMGTAADSLQTTSKQLNDMQDTLSSSWREYERRFSDVDRSLGDSMEQITRGFDLYAEKIRELNSGLDVHLSKALSDLSSVINELHESVEELQAANPSR
jgi:ABC-type transporter Mla subunit MlaD